MFDNKPLTLFWAGTLKRKNLSGYGNKFVTSIYGFSCSSYSKP